jgi:hypothetical protein
MSILAFGRGGGWDDDDDEPCMIIDTSYHITEY